MQKKKFKTGIMRKSLILFISLMLLLNFSTPVLAQQDREFEMQFDDDLLLDLRLQTRFEGEFAFNIRDQIDNVAGVGNDNGFIEQPEIDAKAPQMKSTEISQISITMDGVTGKLVSSSLEFSGLGLDAHSHLPISMNYSITVEWPELDLNKSSHKFEKMQTEPMTTIKISFSKKWEIGNHTGINGSKLSKNKRSIEGNEWPGFKVVVNFKKAKVDDDGGLPGFDAGISLVAFTVVAILFAGRRYRS